MENFVKSMSNNTVSVAAELGAVVEEKSEIPRELFSLGNSLDEQDETVKALREVLAMVMRRVDATEEPTTEARPECYTDLGDKLASYRLRVNQHTKELKYLLRSLEL